MANQRKSRKNWNGMSYREVQRANSQNSGKLTKADQRWLKENSYRNVGWEAVINLYQKIEEFFDKAKFEDMSLEELFLEADRIGNKYLTPHEVESFNHQFSKEVAEIGELVDQQFPDTQVEIIDYRSVNQKSGKKRHQKT